MIYTFPVTSVTLRGGSLEISCYTGHLAPATLKAVPELLQADMTVTIISPLDRAQFGAT